MALHDGLRGMSNIENALSLASALPIDVVQEDLLHAFQHHPNTVLVAEPGAGKTTRVPLWLLNTPQLSGRKIILLEPRRVAARAAAQRMAESLGEQLGDTIGLRMRGETRLSAATRLEVVTDGVFARQIIADPELKTVGAVLFDEFHERALDGDLGLALALDVQGALRPDLKLMIMSATLDADAVSAFLGHAPIIHAKGRNFPVETHYIAAPTRRGQKPALIPQTVRAIETALAKHMGDVLVFLPGRFEIEATARSLKNTLSDDVFIASLYAGLPSKAQARALAATKPGTRKIILATTIAQTSLTIEGIRIVVDSGLVRRPRFNAHLGVAKLETVRVSQAAADQRRGRAGRMQSGVCYRLWPAAETKALAPYDKAEILEADLAAFVLTLADWGVSDPAQLKFLDLPAKGRFQSAQRALQRLGALQPNGAITSYGQTLQSLPLAPDLAAMLMSACARSETYGRSAALLAVLLDSGQQDDELDLRVRFVDAQKTRQSQLNQRFTRLCRAANIAPKGVFCPRDACGSLLLTARPQWLAINRGQKGDKVSFQLVSGQRVEMDITHPLAFEKNLVIADMMGDARNLRPLALAPLAPAEFSAHCTTHAHWDERLYFDPVKCAVRAQTQKRLGALVLETEYWDVSNGAAAEALFWQSLSQLAETTKALSVLPWEPRHAQLHERLLYMNQTFGSPWPDVNAQKLSADMAEWLAPYCPGIFQRAAVDGEAVYQALLALAPDLTALNHHAPKYWPLADGGQVAIDYGDPNGPTMRVKVQRLFGLAHHPTLPNGTKLILDLLSPAARSLQVTTDLTAFWGGSWSDVRADMRGRYPKHDWPADPQIAQPSQGPKGRR